MSTNSHINKALFQAEFGPGIAYDKILRFVYETIPLAEFAEGSKPTNEELRELVAKHSPLALYERATLLDALTDESGVEVALIEIIALHDIKPKTLYETADLLDTLSDEELEAEYEARNA